MKRVLLIILLHLSLFFIVFAYHAQAKEEGWSIHDFKDYTYLSRNGNVIHADRLSFAMEHENCNEVSHLFTFLTTKAPNDIHQFLNKRLPIKINNYPLTAQVIYINSVLNDQGYWVLFELGQYESAKYASLMTDFSSENKNYEIVINDGLNFVAKDYFDITYNNWTLAGFNKKFEEAFNLCKEKGNTFNS